MITEVLRRVRMGSLFIVEVATTRNSFRLSQLHGTVGSVTSLVEFAQTHYQSGSHHF